MQEIIVGLQKTIDSLTNTVRESWTQWSNDLKAMYEVRLQENEVRYQETEQRRLASEEQNSKLLEQIARQNLESQQKQESQKR